MGVPWRGGQVTIGILLVILSLLPVSAVALGLGTLAGERRLAVAVLVSSLLLGLVILAVVWRLGLARYRAPLSALGLTPPGLPWVQAAALTLGALLVSLGFNILYATLVKPLGSDLLSPPDIPRGIALPGPAVVFTFQALALWTPLAEEVFFRGFVFAGLIHRLGVPGALVASALVFSIFHLSQGSPGVLVPIFITGLLLAWLYYRTGSLWASIVAHGSQNATALAGILYEGWTRGQT
jgi:membrane protease YdiL (CAAX protease family)